MRMWDLKDDGEKREEGEEFFVGIRGFWWRFGEHLTMIFVDKSMDKRSYWKFKTSK